MNNYGRLQRLHHSTNWLRPQRKRGAALPASAQVPQSLVLCFQYQTRHFIWEFALNYAKTTTNNHKIGLKKRKKVSALECYRK